MRPKHLSKERTSFLLYGGLVLLMSYFTYMHNYWYPEGLYWDENYHIASAQKYLHGVFFMEPHPPLGKLLIALGEKLLSPNENTDQFLNVMYGQGSDLPEDVSFAGYRFFPALLAWLSAPLMFSVFFLITRHHLMSILLSFLYVFDNALIVHLRGAMLDSTMLFFFIATIHSYLAMRVCVTDRKKFFAHSIVFGVSFACVVATKANGLILLALLPAFLWEFRSKIQKLRGGLAALCLVFIMTYVGIWSVHFALASSRNVMLENEGYFSAGDAYRSLFETGENVSLLHFPIMFADSMRFFAHYQRGVPELDLCKAGEGGSPAFLWPFGGRTINYRWSTPDSQHYSYLYLQSNPVVWFTALAGVLLTCVLLLGGLLLPVNEKPGSVMPLIALATVYFGYMFVMLKITRVMYLYHYFPPLITGMILFGLAFAEIRHFAGKPVNETQRMYALLGLCTFIVLSFQFFRPLTYHLPLTKEQFQRRALLRIWDLKCVNCETDNGMTTRSC